MQPRRETSQSARDEAQLELLIYAILDVAHLLPCDGETLWSLLERSKEARSLVGNKLMSQYTICIAYRLSVARKTSARAKERDRA